MDRFAAGLGLGKPEHCPLKIDIFLLERRNFAVPGSGQQQQAIRMAAVGARFRYGANDPHGDKFCIAKLRRQR